MTLKKFMILHFGLDAAEEIAQANPYITSIRIYEIR
jgi:hypothetical protein